MEVQPAIEHIICPCTNLELEVGKSIEWKYQIVPENAYGKDLIRVESNDNDVARYRRGYVEGLKLGECKIYIRFIDKNQEKPITLRELSVKVRRKRCCLWPF